MAHPHRPFTGKTALITGAASGIGKATALAFTNAGANVALFDITPQKAAAVGALLQGLAETGGQAQYYETDITSPENIDTSLEAACQDFHKIDILVHSAGIGIEKPFLETTADDWQQVIDIDLTGTFLCCQAVAKKMLPHKYGRIITIASTAAIRGGVGRAAYGAAKGGVMTLTKVMAVELAAHGITVNSLAPGAIETELVTKMHSPETRETYTKSIPMKRYGTPEETAHAALFLASDGASYINGHCLAVDGGFLGAGLMPEDISASD